MVVDADGQLELRRLALRNPMFAAISADIERQWLNLGVPHERMIRMASGVDAEHFRPGPSLVEPQMPPRPRVVFTGTAFLVYVTVGEDLEIKVSVPAREGASSEGVFDVGDAVQLSWRPDDVIVVDDSDGPVTPAETEDAAPEHVVSAA